MRKATGRVIRLIGLISLVAYGASPSAHASTLSGTLGTSFSIVDSCTMGSITNVNFGSSSSTASAITATGSIIVTCNNGGVYNIGLDQGAGSGATVAARKMTASGGATTTYSLYQNSGYSTLWGNTIGTNTFSTTGTGSAQTFTVYGQIPVQTTPLVGSYSDTVNITVTY